MSNISSTSEDTSLSGLWRENKSKDPGTDLASILDSARIMAQSLIPDTDVTFAGVQQATTEQKRISLSARGLGNEFPVPGDKVDRILGLTAHEIGHILFSEKNKPKYLENLYRRAGIYQYGTNVSKERQYFGDLVDTFEDIYVDHLMTAYPGYHDYLKRERAAVFADYDLPKLAKPLMVECDRYDMLNALVYLALYGGKLPDKITTKNTDILEKLTDLAMRMVTKKIDKDYAVLSAYRILKTLPEHIDHNADGLMNIPDEPTAQKPDETQSGESSDETKGEEKLGEESNEQGGESGQEPETEDETEETPESGEGDGGGEKTESEGNGDEEETEPEDEGKDSGEGEESEEMEPDAAGGGAGDEATNEPEAEQEPVATEPPKWEPVNLAAHLNDMVDDKTELKPEIAQEVSDAIIEKRADLSQLLSYLAKDSDYTVLAYTPKEDAEETTEARNYTAEAEEKLRRILQDYRTKRTKDYRGLMSGRVSSRRLYRTAYGDQRVFQRRERPDEINMVVCLLMDLSGSVERQQELIFQIVCAITDAFTKEKLEFIALGYSEEGHKVYIPRLYDKETGRVNLELEQEWGTTPSYEGLAAAIAQLLRLGGTKQKVLFHFTDGYPNSYTTPTIPNLLEDARSKGIIDIHICMSKDGTLSQHFDYLYGKNLLAITDISQLPEVVDKMLREKLEI